MFASLRRAPAFGLGLTALLLGLIGSVAAEDEYANVPGWVCIPLLVVLFLCG